MGQILEIETYLRKRPDGEAQVGTRDRRILSAQLDMRSRQTFSRMFVNRFKRVCLPALTLKEIEWRERNWRKQLQKENRKKKKGRHP